MIDGTVAQSWWMVIVVCQDRFIREPMSSGRVRESYRDLIVKCYRLEEYRCVGVNLANGMRKIVIKLLEFCLLGHGGHNQCNISNRISDKWLVDQFVTQHILVSFESVHNFQPEFREFFIQMRSFSIEFIKSIPNVIAKIIFSPSILIALVPSRQPTFVEFDLLPHGEWECFVQFKLICEPSWYSVTTELLGDEILMEVDQSVNSMTACSINQGFHDIQIGLIIMVFLGFDSCPPTSQISYIIPRRIPLYPHFVQLTMSSSEKDHSGSQASIRGRQGGTFTTTFVPWIISSLPFSSMSFLFFMAKFCTGKTSKKMRRIIALVINLL